MGVARTAERETRETGAMELRRHRPGVGGRGRADHRAHRRRHLDRLGHPRLPRPAGRVDEEPGGREDGDDPALPRRPRRPPAGVAEPRWRRRRGRPSRTPATVADRRAAAPGKAARRRHPERRRPAPEGGHRRRAGGRGARHDLVDALLGLPGPPADGRDARPGPRRRGRSAVPGVRRDPEERHDLVRPGAGAEVIDRAMRSARSATCCSPSARR